MENDSPISRSSPVRGGGPVLLSLALSFTWKVDLPKH